MTEPASLTPQPLAGSLAATSFTRRSPGHPGAAIPRRILLVRDIARRGQRPLWRSGSGRGTGHSPHDPRWRRGRMVHGVAQHRRACPRIRQFRLEERSPGECPGGVPAGIELLPNRRVLSAQECRQRYRGACSGPAVPPDVRQRNQFDGPSGASHRYPLRDDDAARLSFSGR